MSFNILIIQLAGSLSILERLVDDAQITITLGSVGEVDTFAIIELDCFGVVVDGSLEVPFGKCIIALILPMISSVFFMGGRHFADIGLFFLEEFGAGVAEGRLG